MGSTTIVVILSAILAVAWSYPTTVPPSPEVCSKMTPGHGPSPQKSKSPYTIDVSTANVKGGNNVQVTLSGNGETFKGFYVQARDAQGNRVGTFIPDDGAVKVHGCGGIKNNAAHHSGKDDKQSITVHWKAPQAFSGQVTFVATFVHEFETFWTNVKSGPVTVTA